jgi:tRNA-binding EMAP/Myf-like protein
MNSTLSKPDLSYEEFTAITDKLSISVGTIIHAERIPKSNGLKLTVAFEEPEDGVITYKTSFTNLGKTMEPIEFVGMNCPFIMNLAPSEIKGVKSEVMIMVGESREGKIEIRNYTRGTKLM